MIRITERKLFGTVVIENDKTGDALSLRYDELDAMAAMLSAAIEDGNQAISAVVQLRAMSAAALDEEMKAIADA